MTDSHKQKEIYMKKFVIGSLVALAASSSFAWDLSVTQTRDFGTVERNGAGLAVGHNVGPVHVSLGAQRFQKGNNDLDRYSLMASYDVVKTKLGNFSVKGGGAYLNNQVGQDGYAAVAGVGYTFPITKALSFGLDATRQFGQDRVSRQDGNAVTAALTVKF